MITEFEYSTLSHQEDAQQLGKILSQCFIDQPDSIEIYFNRIGVDKFRIIRTKQIAGGLAIIPMGQWWNGQCVPMTGIAAVGIAPEYRGSGAAISLMQHTLKELYNTGASLSVLFPATQQLYRKVGYEQGGIFCGWEILTHSIQVQKQSLPIQSIPVEYDFQKIYQQTARLTSGHLERNQVIWDSIVKPDAKETLHAYLLGSPDRPQGYIIYSQNRAEDGPILQIKDYAVLTPTAGRSFWSFIALHRSQIKKVQWRGSAIDYLTLLLPEQTAKTRFVEKWMLRVVDVIKALEQRGYPLGIQTELHLEVQDDLLPENNGKFILSVSNGKGQVTRGGKGELKLDVRGLAPLYSSLFTPHQLQLAGYLEASTAALSAATQIFAGALPWMPDFF